MYVYYLLVVIFAILQKTSLIFKNKNKAGKVVLKGIAFPVCLSVNEIVCHCSPLDSEDAVSFFDCCVLVFVLEIETHRSCEVDRSRFVETAE
jgi:hypothetical protein